MDGMAKQWHNHDHRYIKKTDPYYTETETDALLDAKVDSAWFVRQVAPAGSGTQSITITTGTTLTSMDFAVEANSVWQVEIDAPRMVMLTGTGGVKFRMDTPSGEIDLMAIGTGASESSLETSPLTTPGTLTTDAFVTALGINGHVRITGVIRIGNTGGTVYPMIAVVTSGDEAAVYEEYLTLRADRVA